MSQHAPTGRHRLFEPQMIMAVCAVLISLCAVSVSIYETSLMREHQRLSVWPRLEIMKSYGNNRFVLNISNRGTGPALIQSVVVTVDGTPVDTWQAMMKKLHLDGKPISFAQSQINRRVIRAGENIEAFLLKDPQYADQVGQAMIERVDVIICFQSIYGEGWTSRFQANIPEPAECNPDVTDQFEQ